MRTLFATANIAIGAIASAAVSQARVPDDAYVGTWRCDGGAGPTFEIGPGTYAVMGSTGRIAKVERFENDFLITLSDGYRFSLLEVTDLTMVWHSPLSGDTFVCSKLPSD